MYLHANAKLGLAGRRELVLATSSSEPSAASAPEMSPRCTPQTTPGCASARSWNGQRCIRMSPSETSGSKPCWSKTAATAAAASSSVTRENGAGFATR